MADTATADAPLTEDVDAAFRAALEEDAQVPHTDIPGPPRKAVSVDPDAPHGRDEDGKPLAPFGLVKGTGRPRLKPAGPGRPKADAPRVTAPDKAPAPAGVAGGRDYSADLAGLGISAWIGASAIRGGRVPLIGVRLPDLRPYAGVFHSQMPDLVAAWNVAAQQNATVRGYVEKLAGEGSYQWVLGVAVSSANFLGGCVQLARADPSVKAEWSESNDAAVKEFLRAQAAASAAPAGEGEQ